jgi:hypothetical protein
MQQSSIKLPGDDSIEALIKRGMFRACNDGMFGFTQSYELAEAAHA